MKRIKAKASPPEENRNGQHGLERQVIRGSLFTHTALGRQAERINEIESFLFGLIDMLEKKGGVEPAALKEAADAVRREMIEKNEHAHAGVGIRMDPEEASPSQPVNCAERMHVCQAVCCRLNFPLSIEEIESGVIKWDLGRPYFIRQEKNGYCSHIDPERKCCSIYDQRPGTCRTYSCAGDSRIWKDFDNMVLNDEWIADNLEESKPTLLGALMVPEMIIEEPENPHSE